MKTPADLLVRVVLVGALLAAAGTATAQPALAGQLIEVTAAGVTFESDAENATVEYWITDLKGNNIGYYWRSLSRHDTDGGYAAFTEAVKDHPGAYCVAAVRVERAGDWWGWSEGLKSYKCAQAEPSPTPTTQSPAPTTSAASPTATPTASSAPAVQPTPKPSPTPTPTPSRSPSQTPSPSPELSLSPLPPVPEPAAGGPEVTGQIEADAGLAIPVEDLGDSGPTGLGWLAALAGGLLAAAGGGLVLLNRRRP